MAANLFSQDILLLRRDGTTLTLVLPLIAALALAAVNGASIASEQRSAIEAHVAAIEEDQAKPNPPISPAKPKRPVVLPVEPLANLSTGRLRLDPSAATVSWGTRSDTLFRNHQVAGPLALQAGGFDLSFIVVVVVPLLIIALGHGMLAADRDSGRLRLLLANPTSVSRMLWSRVLVRATLLAVPVYLTALITVLATAPVGHLPIAELAVWLAMTTLYMAFWWVVVAFASTLTLRAETLAVALLAAWTLLVFIVPACAAALAGILNPPPSRQALIADVRHHEAQARESATSDLKRYLHDHPDLQQGGGSGAYVADWMKTIAMANLRVEQAIADPLDAFDRALTQQHQTARLAEFLSPALALHRALNQVAGTDEMRHLAYRKQALAYRDKLQSELRPFIIGGRALSTGEVDALPRFHFSAPAANLGGIVVGLWLSIAALAFVATHVRLHRFELA